MKTAPRGALTGFSIALIAVLAGCATDSSTPLGQTVGVEIETAPSSLEGTVDQEYGGSPAGVVLRIRGSSSSDLYYWTVTDDSGTRLTLPAGLSKTPDDPTIPTVVESNRVVIRGTPTECGRFPLRIVVHNYPQHQQILSYTTAIDIGGPTCPPPTITSSSLVFFQDFPNERRLSVAGGAPPFTWSATGLPSGITLDAQTGALSGTPTSSGTSPVTVRVTDSKSRSHERTIALEIRVVALADFTGTWSGLLTKGFLVTSGPTITNVTGQRLSLLFKDQALRDVAGQQVLASPVDQGTLDATVLSGLAFTLTPGPYPGLFNGAIDALGWHLGCDLLPSGELECTGHSYSGPQYNAEVVLTRLNVNSQDSVAPTLAASVPADGDLGVTSFEVRATFSEAMSGSAAVALTGGAGTAGTPAFDTADPTRVTIPLAGLQPNTPYTVTLNPSGAQGFKDLAGNPLATRTITFSTGTLAPVALSISAEGTGAGRVTSVPAGIDCGATCLANFSTGTTITLTALPDFGSEFIGWTDPVCPGTGACTLTLSASRSVGARFALIPSFTLSVAKDGSGVGTILSDDSEGRIECGPLCQADYLRDTVVTLDARPDASSSTFSGWGGACSGVTVATCAVSMTASKSVTATFNLVSRTLTVTKAGTGIGTISSTPTGITACSATCSATFAHGTLVTLTAAPAPDSTFTGWTGGCSGSGVSCSLNMDAAKSVTATFGLQTYALTVTKTGSGNGSVSSTPTGIASCSTTCTADFSHGAVVSLTPDPAPDSTFSGWAGACTGSGACTVTMDSAKSVTATFAIRTYTLTVTTSGSGSVTSTPTGIDACSSTCSASFSHATTVTLTASSGSGSVFTGWSGEGCSGIGPCQITMTTDRSVTAAFGTQATYELTLTIGGNGSGSVTSTPSGIACPGACSSNFAQNQSVTLTALPSQGSNFTGWSGTGISCPGTGSCTVSMDSAKSVTATFVLQSYALTIAKSGAGSGTVTSSPTGINCGSACSFNFDYNTQVTLTATPTGGSTFVGWSGSGISCPGTGTCTVTMTSSLTVTATFSTISYSLTVTPNGVGTGQVISSPTGIDCGSVCSANFSQNTTVTLTATPATGSSFGGWSGAGCSGTGTCSVLMDASKSVTATFTAQTYALTVTLTGTGAGSVTSNPVGIDCGSDCSESYGNGTTVTLAATPNSGSVFGGWSGACTGIGTCTVTMTSARNVTATFTDTSGVNQPPVANSQIVRVATRQQTTRSEFYRYAITLTGTDPEGGPLTFRIVTFPTYRDTNHSMGVTAGLLYRFIDPASSDTLPGAATVATTSSTVDLSTGAMTVSPAGSPFYVNYVPQVCHNFFSQDSFTFVAIDAEGAESQPATITINVQVSTCNHF